MEELLNFFLNEYSIKSPLYRNRRSPLASVLTEPQVELITDVRVTDHMSTVETTWLLMRICYCAGEPINGNNSNISRPGRAGGSNISQCHMIGSHVTKRDRLKRGVKYFHFSRDVHTSFNRRRCSCVCSVTVPVQHYFKYFCKYRFSKNR